MELAGLLLGPDDGLPGICGEAFEHGQSFRRSGPRPLAYFLCTACRVTPSSWAICSQVQPWSRALVTCSASRRSTSVRRDRTARSPTAGSRLLAADATCAVSAMAVNLGCYGRSVNPRLTRSWMSGTDRVVRRAARADRMPSHGSPCAGDDLVVGHRGLAIDEVPVVLGVEDSPLDLVAGEPSDRVP